MKKWSNAARLLLGIVLSLWMAVLIALGTSVVLFYAGLIIPNVTVRTIIEGWGWTALGLTFVILGKAACRPKLSRLFARSSLRAYGWSTLFVLSLIVLFYVIERWRGHHAWQRLVTNQPGGTFELMRLEPSKVPDEQNFATLPFVEAWWVESVAGADQSRLGRLAEPLKNAGGGAWEVQRSVDLAACLKQYVPSASTAEKEISPDRFLDAWKEFEPEIGQLEAGTERPYARFDLPYDRGMFDNTLGRRLKLFDAAAQAFRLRAVGALNEGATGRALADVEVLLRLSELLSQEPLLERQRLEILLAAIQPVWEGVTRNQWSEAQLAALQAFMERPDLFREYRQAIRTQCLLLTDLCEKLFPIRSRVPATDFPENFSDRLLITSLRFVYPKGWLLQNVVGLHELGFEIREQTVAPAEHHIFLESTRQIVRHWVYRPPSLDPFFATFLMPRGGATVEDVVQRYAYAQCALDLCATACALERYRLARGQLPQSLHFLVPDWIDRIPTDVIDGRPLRYHRLDQDHFILYSVGWNETDDGGTVAMRPGPRRPWEDSAQIKDEGDWAWRAKPGEPP